MALHERGSGREDRNGIVNSVKKKHIMNLRGSGDRAAEIPFLFVCCAWNEDTKLAGARSESNKNSSQ